MSLKKQLQIIPGYKSVKAFQRSALVFHCSCCYFFTDAVSQDDRTLLTYFSPFLPFPWVLLYLVKQKLIIWNPVPDLLFFVSGCRQSLSVFFQKHELIRTTFLISVTFQKQKPFLSNSPVYLSYQQIPHLIQQERNVTQCATETNSSSEFFSQLSHQKSARCCHLQFTMQKYVLEINCCLFRCQSLVVIANLQKTQ